MMDQNQRPTYLEDVAEEDVSFWSDTDGFELPDECREANEGKIEVVYGEPLLNAPEDYLEQFVVWSRYCEKMEIRIEGSDAVDVYEVIDGSCRRSHVILSDEENGREHL